MQIVPSTFLALLAIVVLAVQGPRRGLWAFLALAPFGAAAAFNLPALGGASIGLKELAAVAVFALVLLAPAGPARILGSVRPGQPGFWLAVLLLFGIVSALFAPRLFAGATEVFSISRAANGRGIVSTPLRPDSGNITQLFILTLSALAFVALAATFRAAPDPRAVLTALAVTTWVHVALGWLDVATAAVGAGALLEPIRTANYAILDSHRMLGMKRMIGGFPEASSFGAFSVGLFAFWFQYWLSRRGSTAGALALLAALVAVLRSTSSGAYVSLVAFLVLWGGAGIVAGLRQRVGRRQVAAVALGAISVLAAAVILLGAYLAVDPVTAFLDRVLFDKLETRSGVERMSWNWQALRNMTQTWGLGAGLGSVRASSWIFASLGSLGLLGTALFLRFLLAVASVPRSGDAEIDAVLSALKAALVALFVNDLLTGSTPNLGVYFFALAGLAVGLSRGGRLRPRRGAPAPGHGRR